MVAFIVPIGFVTACAPGSPEPSSVSAPAASTPSDCAEAGRALDDGLLNRAEERYLAVLSPPSRPSATAAAPTTTGRAASPVPTTPSNTPSASIPPAPTETARECALAGVVAVRSKRADAAGMVAAGEHALRTGQYATAQEWFEQAQKTDLDNKDAAAGLVAVREETAGTGHPTTLVGYGDVLLRLALPFLGALVTMLLFVRLLLGLIRLTPKPRQSSNTDPSAARPPPRRKVVSPLVAGLAVVAGIAGAAGAAWVIAGYADVGGWLVLAGSAVAGCFAASVIAVRLSRRLRVRFEVRGADNAVDGQATAFLVGRLAALGGQRPQGLLIPRGTDVVALPDEALAAMPQSAVLKALLNLGWTLFHLSPWRVTVTMGAGDRASIEISRNRRPVVTDVLWTREIVPPDDDVADVSYVLLTGAAALVLVTLSEAHTELGKGLCGTKNWRSLTKQVLATEPPYLTNSHVRTHLLAEAIDVDPGNRLAWYAYLLSLVGSEPALVDEWSGVARRLDALYRVLPGSVTKTSPTVPADGYTALRIRIMYSSAVGWLRHGEDEDKDHPADERAEAFVQAKESATTMLSAVTAAGGEDRVGEFAKEMKPMAETLVASVVAAEKKFAEERKPMAETLVASVSAPEKNSAEAGPVSDPGGGGQEEEAPDDPLDGLFSKSLRTLYVEACHQARISKRQEAFAALGLAVGLPINRLGARNDPAFRELRNHGDFRRIMTGQPDIGGLKPIRSYRSALHARAVFVPGDLLARSASDDEGLAAELGVRADAIVAWRELCRLVVSCPEPAHAVAWTNLLHDAGIVSPADLRRSFETAARRREAGPIIAALAAAAQVAVPGAEHLEKWAESAGGAQTE
ncbi:hypothetical protein JIG36_04890 [Actinoplanes sp. LDG1-06]|uniref:Uncharacterized protein n=1 Tax=Paractinoplanes ovalisporus TaxID=2810368 RepID=A0ABS2A4X6_9ACTN|nr:hypothetical protein [Actinoplanes ovalisporus]MBM2614893.1 hypothetical protein [Actinoplanes ovalisporus]